MDAFLAALSVILMPLPLALVALGTFLGITVGAIPGLSGAMLITLALPFTFFMQPTNGVILLVAMYVGAISGGLISATLLRMPGTPASVVTTFDGYPMAKAGQPGRAMGLGIGASLVGGIFAFFALVFLTEPLSQLATRFGPFEYFSLILMALVLIASVSEGSMAKGVLGGLLGVMVSMPGIDPSTGHARMTWDWTQLNGGLALVPVLIGVFAVSQIISELVTIDRKAERLTVARRDAVMTLADWKAQALNMIRSSVIGTWIGILPGVGANIGSIIAYTAAKNVSKNPEEFGRGAPAGIVASEAANNATVGGALIPLIAMGIPGSVIDTILLGGLMMHNIQPGPLLFVNNPGIVHALMAAYLLATILMYVMMTGLIAPIARLMFVPRAWLMPVILVFCLIGAFSLNNSMFDVWVMLAFGLFGFALEKAKVPLAPFVIGFVLAPLAESQLRSGLMLSAGSFEPLVTRPVSLAFLLAAVVLLVWPFLRSYRASRRKPAAS